MAEDAAEPDHQRMVLLNRLVSRSISHAPQEHRPPIHGAAELLKDVADRWKQGFAVEFLGIQDKGQWTDPVRLTKGEGHDYVALRDYAVETRGAVSYAKLLIEFVDQNLRSFPVVDTKSFKGRELSGADAERGVTAAHVVVRLPGKDDYDDGSYRCVVEAVHRLNRTDIERFLCRQLRRAFQNQRFGVTIIPKKGNGKKSIQKEYDYWPRLELFADVFRKISLADDDGKFLSHMVFTKRGEKQNLAKATSITHENVIADVIYNITAKQGPTDKTKLLEWVTNIRGYFETRGYESKLYYRGIGGGTMSGDVHKAVAGATDLLMCPRATIVLKGEWKQWQEKLNPQIVDKMIELLDKNELWERNQ